MTDSIAGPSDQFSVGDRIRFTSEDGESWCATVKSVALGSSSHIDWWLGLDWDDGMVDDSLWPWPAADLDRLN